LRHHHRLPRIPLLPCCTATTMIPRVGGRALLLGRSARWMDRAGRRNATTSTPSAPCNHPMGSAPLLYRPSLPRRGEARAASLAHPPTCPLRKSATSYHNTDSAHLLPSVATHAKQLSVTSFYKSISISKRSFFDVGRLSASCPIKTRPSGPSFHFQC